MSDSPPSYIDGPHGRIAYRLVQGDGPTLVWLGGFKSDMLGSKAEHLNKWARQNGRAYLRFDYSGHGESEGIFEDGCISEWTADARAVIEAVTDGPLILIGSSMGGWVTCLLVQDLKQPLAGAVFIAPAPDFTESLMWPSLSEQDRETIMHDGRLEQRSDYADEPTVLTRKLFEDGRNNLVLHNPIPIDAPVRIIQGMDDPDVPYTHAFRLADRLTSNDVVIGMTKSGDHRMSTPEDLMRLTSAIIGIH